MLFGDVWFDHVLFDAALQEHASPAVICRDRATAYAEAARTAAPEAVQVADRFHLWQNLAAAVEKCVARHKSCLADPVDTTLGEPVEAEATEPTGAMDERRRDHHALVHELLAQGAGFRQIARQLGWSHRTVSKYAHAATWQELVVGQTPRPSLVDPFKPYLAHRIGDGCLKPAPYFERSQSRDSPAATRSSASSSSSTAADPT